MRVGCRVESGRLVLDLEPNAAEVGHRAHRRFELDPDGPREVFVELPPDLRDRPGRDALAAVHPDLLALVALLVVAPFVRGRLDLDAAVSAPFAETVARTLSIQVGPVDDALTPRATPDGPAPTALAFSGGVDSCAASLVLPEDTVHVFLHRAGGPRLRPARYRPEAALASVRAVGRTGREALALRSTLEFVRRPAGYPVDWSNAAPAVLAAATRPLGSLAFGVILEAAYSLSKNGYRPRPGGRALTLWAPVFAAVGLPLVLPLAAASEVVTGRMMLEAGAHLQPQSCVRGLPGRPCHACVKCFRKGLIDAAWVGRPPGSRAVARALTSPEVRSLVRAAPMRCEISLAWALGRLPLPEDPVLQALHAKTAPARRYAGGLDFLTSLHTPALGLMPEWMRARVQPQLEEFAPLATPAEVAAVQGWDATALVDEPDYRRAQERVLALVPARQGRLGEIRRRAGELRWGLTGAVQGRGRAR